MAMGEEINRAHYEENKLYVLSTEAALNRSLPTVLIPILGGKKAKRYTPPAIPSYEEALQQRREANLISPISGTRYDSSHEKDTFVSTKWWENKDPDIIAKQIRMTQKRRENKENRREKRIGGAVVLEGKHIEELPDTGAEKMADSIIESSLGPRVNVINELESLTEEDIRGLDQG